VFRSSSSLLDHRRRHRSHRGHAEELTVVDAVEPVGQHMDQEAASRGQALALLDPMTIRLLSISVSLSATTSDDRRPVA
jgi:hypothetical protein